MPETAEEEAVVPHDVDFDKIATITIKYPSPKQYGQDKERYISWYKTTPLGDVVRRFFANRVTGEVRTWKIMVGGTRAEHMMMGSVPEGKIVKLKTKH